MTGDWIAGLGSRNASAGDLSGRLAYAMKVQEIITLAEYDQRAENEWPEKIPNVTSRDLAVRLGDCIYSYASGSPPYQRAGVHSAGNKKADLGGLNVLLSEDFYYLGSCAVELPAHLTPIVHQTQGHKSTANAPYVAPFEHWIGGSVEVARFSAGPISLSIGRTTGRPGDASQEPRKASTTRFVEIRARPGRKIMMPNCPADIFVEYRTTVDR
jgi:hypothetical protein